MKILYILLFTCIPLTGFCKSIWEYRPSSSQGHVVEKDTVKPHQNTFILRNDTTTSFFKFRNGKVKARAGYRLELVSPNSARIFPTRENSNSNTGSFSCMCSDIQNPESNCKVFISGSSIVCMADPCSKGCTLKVIIN